MDSRDLGSRDELWRIQEVLNDLSATQALHSERIMRLEQKTTDGEPSPNPAAEAFRNFDADPGTSMMSSLTLDANDDPRRAAASRANSVRFDETANNHYGSSRQSMELPPRTGSGLGGHPLSERSLSHRSDGRPSAGFGRTNSFGLEQSRLLGSIHNSPRVSGNPPPGFFVLGPCPSIIRCWLTQSFSNASLLYAAVCTGSATSLVTHSLLERLELTDSIIDEGETRAIRLPVYLTEAKVTAVAAARSASPIPHIPTLSVKFVVDEHPALDPSIQIMLGSDVLRVHNADVLLSQDKLMIFDEERNQLSIPLVRPEDDATFKDLCTVSRQRALSMAEAVLPPPVSLAGVIGRPARVSSTQETASPAAGPSSNNASTAPSEAGQNLEPSTRSSLDLNQPRTADDSKSTSGSEKSFSTPASKTGVWSSSWRSGPSTTQSEQKAASSYARPSSSRPMKILRPSKTMANATRGPAPAGPAAPESDATPTKGETKKAGPHETSEELKSPSATTKSNPVGSGSAFGWLNAGSARRTTANS